MQKLETMRDGVQVQVDAARRNVEIVGNDVEEWLTSVDNIREAADRIISEKAEIQKGLSTMNEIIETLKNDQISMTGICGMLGMGKEVAKKVKEDNLFDEIVMSVVSQKAELSKIQRDIAEMLDLQLEEQNPIVRAGRLCKRLENNKKILVILDDVWAEFNVEALGFPLGGGSKGFKILFISRNRYLWSRVQTKIDISLDVLHEEEAWNLFRDKVGNSATTPDPQPISKEIVEECERLPLAPVTIGSALLNKSKHSEHVKMPEVVRDVAIAIGSRDKRVLVISDGLKLREGPKDMHAHYNCISVISENTRELPVGFRSSKLELLQCTSLSSRMLDSFFDRMRELKVLDVRCMMSRWTPLSLRFLRNLRTLCLDYRLVGDISAIGELLNQEILSFCGSLIQGLPEEIRKLINLRLLDLRKCIYLSRISLDVISGLARLQELYMRDSLFGNWDGEEDIGGKTKMRNASLRELESLSNLNTLLFEYKFYRKLPELLSVGFGFVVSWRRFARNLLANSKRVGANFALKKTIHRASKPLPCSPS
ncbi:unnamed protein product [Camellia sinensis]